MISGKEQFKAGDLSKYLVNFEILNPELIICTMDSGVDTKLEWEIRIGKGRGYVPSELNQKEGLPIGTIFIDSIYTPIINVKYEIQNHRVEQKTDYEKLKMEVITDGSIHPKIALKEAAMIVMQHMSLFTDDKISIETPTEENNILDENSLHTRQLLKTKLTSMNLSVRALNCLKAAEVDTLGELVSFYKSDLLKFRNFGRKSLTELEDLVRDKGLNFGMDVSKYMLDKD
jgi:DNA-directed RNA polymerase subunit alpha